MAAAGHHAGRYGGAAVVRSRTAYLFRPKLSRGDRKVVPMPQGEREPPIFNRGEVCFPILGRINSDGTPRGTVNTKLMLLGEGDEINYNGYEEVWSIAGVVYDVNGSLLFVLEDVNYDPDSDEEDEGDDSDDDEDDDEED